MEYQKEYQTPMTSILIIISLYTLDEIVSSLTNKWIIRLTHKARA